MADINSQKTSYAGLVPTFVAAAAGGDAFQNSTGRAILYVKNGGGSPITVTANSQRLSNYAKDNDEVATVPAGGEAVIGPFNPFRFNNADGRVEVIGS